MKEEPLRIVEVILMGIIVFIGILYIDWSLFLRHEIETYGLWFTLFGFVYGISAILISIYSKRKRKKKEGAM